MKTQSSISIKSVYPFVAMTFILTWGLASFFMIFSDHPILGRIIGEMSMKNPLYILAVYSPGFAGTFLVWRKFGLKGLGSFFKRLTLTKASIWWWLLVIFAIPAIMYAGAAIKGTLNDPFPFTPWYEVIPALALALFLGPIEEFGWRGFALPLLQRKFAPFWSGLILGIIWMIWHTPAFLLDGTPQSGWAFAPFFIGGIASSIIFTAMFNSTRGSLFFAVLLHFQMNNPIWPDAQPWDNLLLGLVAIAVIWFNRDMMFKPGTGVSNILMAEDADPV
jgi:membrane protease YdiL (CAAX protease family)